MDGRKRFKLCISAVVAVGLTFLTACGGGGDEEGAGGEQSLTVASWQWTEDRGAAIWAILEGFKKNHPDTTLEQLAIPYKDYASKIATTLSSPGAPDVLQMESLTLAQAVGGNALAPLEPLVDDSSFKGSLLPANEWGVSDGERFGYIWGMSLNGMPYNKNLLAAAGREVPTTFPEFLETARAVTDVSKGQYGFAMRSTMDEASGWFPQLTMFVVGFGAQYLDDKGETVTIDTPEMKRAIDAYMEMYNSGAMLTGVDAATYRRLFADGKIGMTFDDTFGQLVLEWPQMADFANVALAPFEGGPLLVSPLYIGISEQSQNKEVAGQFVEYFLSKPVQDQLSVAFAGEVPGAFDWENQSEAFKQYREKEAYWVGPLESAVDKVVPTVPPGPLAELEPQISQAMLSELSKVQAGEQTVDEMLSNAQATVEEAANQLR